VERVIDQTLQTADSDSIQFLYGLVAEFETADAILSAAGRTREAGYRRTDAFTPFPVDGLTEALCKGDFIMPILMLIGGLLGCIGGFSFLWWCTDFSFPLNIGGAPLFGWPSWVPITFEATVLTSALTGVIGLFAVNGLPMPYHPVFDAPDFDRASSDRYFLCIEAADPKFDREETRQFLQSVGAVQVSAVELRK
jgi:hypothetical protein